MTQNYGLIFLGFLGEKGHLGKYKEPTKASYGDMAFINLESCDRKCIWVTEAFLLGRILWGLLITLLIFGDTHTPAGREFRTHPICWCFLFFFSNPLDEVFVSKLVILLILRLEPFLRPRDISQRCKVEYYNPPLVLTLCWKCPQFQTLLALLFWKLLRVIKFRLSSEVKMHLFILSDKDSFCKPCLILCSVIFCCKIAEILDLWIKYLVFF